MNWIIDFISEENFKHHVKETIKKYGTKLKPYDIKKFNSNLIDPIKSVFDKAVYGWSWEDMVASEIFRQRDKANTNDIGYFHQRIFDYIAGCHVPKNGEEGGWDVIVSKPNGFVSAGDTVHTIYVEMKNKWNTMNHASASDTYIKMQNQLLHDDDCVCYLVEAIAKKHQDIAWETTVNGRKVGHKRIRRVSLDCFYEVVTGEPDAFFQICKVLPTVINEVLTDDVHPPVDTVFNELLEKAGNNDDFSIMMAIYMLGFGTYTGFSNFSSLEANHR